MAQFWQRDCSRRVERADGSVYEHAVELFDYVDMCRVGPRSETDASFVDLVLDVERRPGTVVVLDEDEVDAEAARYGIPAADIAAARIACAEVFDAVSSGREPFGDTVWTWQAKYRSALR